MLVTELDLTMKAEYIQVEKVDDTGDIIEKPAVMINTWIIENKTLYVQNNGSYSRIPSRGYIIDKEYKDKIKTGDKLDGVFIQKINEINDFDGTLDHLEVFTY